MKKIVLLTLGVVTLFAGALLLVATRDRGPPLQTRELDLRSRTFDSARLVAVADADMVGTAYADGVLKPLPGVVDSLSEIDLSAASARTLATAVPNSVTAWPGTLDLSADGAIAYVVESKGRAPANITSVKNVHTDLLDGHVLTTVDLSGELARVIRQDAVGTDPMSVHASPSGTWLAIATREAANALSYVILSAGIPADVRRPSLKLPDISRPSNDTGLTYARIAPYGHTIAVHLANTHVAFGAIEFDTDDRPVGVRLGEPIVAGQYISIGRWSTDGRYYVVADTDWGPDAGDALRAQAGRLISIARKELTGRIVSTASVSFGPEGFESNRAGDLFVVVNMERTYAPDRFPFTLIPRRQQPSLSLVAFDRETGTLRTVDGPLAFDGVLPEDAVFDADGDMVAVAIFHDRLDEPKEGWIELFAVNGSGASARLARTGKRIRTPRGVHDLAVVY